MEKNINYNTFRKNYNDADSGKVFLISLIAPFALALLVSMLISTIADSNDMKATEITSSLAYIIPYTICSFLLYIGIYFFYNKTNKISFSAIKPTFKMPWHTYVLLFVIGVISLFGIQYFIGIIDKFLDVIGYPLEKGLAVLNPTSVGKYFLCVLLLAILPAIGEELIFRGVILHGLRTRFNDVIAVVISAGMFALMHGNLQQLVYPFLLGLIMGWIVLRTGSLISSIIVHFINNFLVVTFSYIQFSTGFSLSLGNAWWTYLVAAILLAFTAGIYFLIDKFYFRHKSHEEVEKSSPKTSKFIYISLAVGAFIFMFATIFQFVAG